VRGAGHEVPMFKPVEALQLFKDFLAISHTGLDGGVVGPNLMQSDDDDDKSAKTDDGDEDDDGNEGSSSSDGSDGDESSSKCAESTQNTSAVAEAGVVGVFAGFVAGVLVSLAWFACCLPGRRQRQQEQEPPSRQRISNSKGRNGNGTWSGSSSRSGEGLEMGHTRGDGHKHRNRDSHGGSVGSSSSSPVRPTNTKAGGFMRVDINERESEEHDQVNPLVHAAAATRTETEKGDFAAHGTIGRESDGYIPDNSSNDSTRTFPEASEGTVGNDSRAFL